MWTMILDHSILGVVGSCRALRLIGATRQINITASRAKSLSWARGGGCASGVKMAGVVGKGGVIRGV